MSKVQWTGHMDSRGWNNWLELRLQTNLHSQRKSLMLRWDVETLVFLLQEAQENVVINFVCDLIKYVCTLSIGSNSLKTKLPLHFLPLLFLITESTKLFFLNPSHSYTVSPSLKQNKQATTTNNKNPFPQSHLDECVTFWVAGQTEKSCSNTWNPAFPWILILGIYILNKWKYIDFLLE